MALQIGQLLNNRYRIDRLLGQGGFGAVYLAWDANLDDHVAIKESLDITPATEKQFRSEAKLLFHLRHPNLPRVFDCFTIPNQGMYLAMDYIEGENLAQQLARGPLPVDKVLGWIKQICDALDYLHQQQPPVIHRDIKPANIIIAKDGRPYLVDFGISKVFDPDRKTTVGARALTPGYSPPEQYGAATTDERSDIYALGATLYHLITGQAPPPAMDIMAGISQPPAPPHIMNPTVPVTVGEATTKAMRPNRTDRWESAGAFKQALSAEDTRVEGAQQLGTGLATQVLAPPDEQTGTALPRTQVVQPPAPAPQGVPATQVMTQVKLEYPLSERTAPTGSRPGWLVWGLIGGGLLALLVVFGLGALLLSGQEGGVLGRLALSATATPAPTLTPYRALSTATPGLTGKQARTASHLFDDFSSNALGWWTGTNAAGWARLQDGNYTIGVTAVDNGVYARAPLDNPPSHIEFTAQITAGEGDGFYCIRCLAQSEVNYYDNTFAN